MISVAFCTFHLIIKIGKETMNNPTSLIYPIVNVIVTALFAGVVLRQYLQRHRVYQLYWSIALTMAFVATLAYVCIVVVGPTSAAGVALFRLYYILGAALMAAWLGLGSLALVTKPNVTRLCLIVLSLLSVLAIVLIATAKVDMKALSQVAGKAGADVLESGAWLPTLIVLNSLGLLAVAGVAVYSGWKLYRRQSSMSGFRTSNLLWANVLILIGASLIGAAGSLARLGLQNTFWLIMAFGWCVFFVGVLLASRRTVSADSASQQASRRTARA